MNSRQVVTIVAAALPAVAAAQAQDRAGERFFEESVRPVLAANCYACHSRQSPQAQGGLRVDSPEAILAGGNAGPLLVPGKPERSLLTRVLSHEDEVKMPPTGKLASGDIAAVERWIRLGARCPARPSRRPRRPQTARTGTGRSRAPNAPPRRPGSATGR